MASSLVLLIWCFLRVAWVGMGVGGVGVFRQRVHSYRSLVLKGLVFLSETAFDTLYTQMNGITCNILMEQWKRLFEMGFCIFL